MDRARSKAHEVPLSGSAMAVLRGDKVKDCG
jgi:hypothetical protein